MNNEQARRRIIAAALFPTQGLLSVTSHYEQLLTEHYVSGVLNADQAIALLEDYQRNQLTTCPIAFGTAPVAQGQPSLC